MVARVSPEELRRMQAERLEKMRQMMATDPERAKRGSHERLVSAGLIQPDGRPVPMYT